MFGRRKKKSGKSKDWTRKGTSAVRLLSFIVPQKEILVEAVGIEPTSETTRLEKNYVRFRF